ncbi:HD domain-containing protein [Thermotalea metallivorans]|uniref:HD domain-containing protein n=1 Tax=Thermotalea metallivorans TaxID=520762 RepID=A0A140L373_9FIRM|nr:HD domain-containing protein [Thermotalea metallivorans]KXG74998.1 hypothetical protein AN619_19680 [Thermotalea metallivorans]
MERINKILNHPQYIEYLARNAQAEADRVFCRHDLPHAIDVARVAYILALEKKLVLQKDIIYAAALLHDIGRWKEYQEGIDHAVAGAELASEILMDCGFSEDEKNLISEAIKTHRIAVPQTTDLGAILYESDKISRLCSQCPAINQCKHFTDGRHPVLFY